MTVILSQYGEYYRFTRQKRISEYRYENHGTREQWNYLQLYSLLFRVFTVANLSGRVMFSRIDCCRS